MNTRARISGLGKYLPERILTNLDLERMVETSDSWIQDRTGIRERRIAADHETSSSMGVLAARQALEQAEIDPADLDLIITATTTPDGMVPACASYVQAELGARRAAAFDLNAACVGFLTGLATGSQFINGGMYQRVLVVGTEVLSRIIDWNDRGTCVIFADGAGAVVLEASEREGPYSFVLHSDGAGAQMLWAPGPCSTPGSAQPGHYYVTMDGPHIFKFAVQAMEAATREAIAGMGITVDEIDLIIPHQANLRIITATAKALGIPMERVMVNVDRYGNTSSASIPLALREAWEQERLKEGDRVVLTAFGGGLVWGAMAFEWAPVGPARLIPEAAHATTGGS